VTEIVGFSFYPDAENPTWGLVHVFTDALGGMFDRRATLRGDVELVQELKRAHEDERLVSDNGPIEIRGTWQITAGWPDDWPHDLVTDDDAWADLKTSP
jgi:hypothetical protein